MAHAITARSVALDVLVAVERDDAYANLLLPVSIRRAELDTRDAQLATELCHGTLRWQGFYDAIANEAGSRSIDSLHLVVRNAIRLGMHQILGMRVTSHAAVNETVAQVKAAKFESAAGYVNAVLRRASERPRDEWVEILASRSQDEVETLSLTTSHPAWIVRALSAALTADNRPDELAELLEADNTPTPVGLIDLDLKNPADADEREPAGYSPRGFHLIGGGSLARATDGTAGFVRVQDEGSQLAALTLVNAAPVRDHEHWLDMCAAPGGKAAVLAAYASESTVVVANESNPSRISLLESSLAPWPRVAITNRDAREFADEGQQFTRILLDAPCSGLGALRRRPESRWRKTPRDIAELTALQQQLLTAACDSLVDGGMVAYVTCSPHIAETRSIVNQVLKKRDDMTELSVSPILNRFTREPLVASGAEKSVQLWPHAHQTDAMFIALLQKATK